MLIYEDIYFDAVVQMEESLWLFTGIQLNIAIMHSALRNDVEFLTKEAYFNSFGGFIFIDFLTLTAVICKSKAEPNAAVDTVGGQNTPLTLICILTVRQCLGVDP
ncbi:hypothetical protein OIU85_019182 [Salix viminalis]|uniref:Uncharacterized protein n=1 Tax=Salix viminalis TaxID=40686 RepID=A0A9Q0UVA9_SALVM|nr:hypothetical protein OIU85_019182 [Salix viminalis]